MKGLTFYLIRFLNGRVLSNCVVVARRARLYACRLLPGFELAQRPNDFR